MSDKRKIVFIVNPISGTSHKTQLPRLIHEVIDEERFNCSIVMTEYAGHGERLAKEARDNGADIVVAVGGDGTVNEVARGVMNTSAALGIVPSGSGNGLARHLMIPQSPKAALKIINQGVIHPLDYGLINDKPFFCTCGMGFDAFISKKFAQAGKRGLMTYLENVLHEGLKYEPEEYEITCNGETLIKRAFLVSIANASQYGNNAYIAPEASMSDGLLDVIIMEPFDMLDAPQIGIDILNKTIDKNYKTQTIKTDNLTIHRQKAGLIHFDGDPMEEGENISIRLVKHGINVVVNPRADKSKRRPSAFQTAFSEFFNELSITRNDLREQSKRLQEKYKTLIRGLNKL